MTAGMLHRMAAPLAMAALCLLLEGSSGADARAPATSFAGDGDLCTFTMQLDSPDACPADGPAATRAQYWDMGLLPRRPMAAQILDPELGKLDRTYAQASTGEPLALYRNVQDAINNSPAQYIEKGLVFVSIIDAIIRDEGKFLVTGSGWIVRRDDVAYPITVLYRQFQAVALPEPPTHAFGWVAYPWGGVRASSEPGGKADPKGTVFSYYGLVEIFDTREVNGLVWYMVGLNEWLSETNVRVVTLHDAPPDGVPLDAKWVSVNLEEQTVAAYEGTRMVFASMAATGVEKVATRPGLFRVQKKYEMQSMMGATRADREDFYYVQDVPWVLYFDEERALHGAYWHDNWGYPRSHGCVNLPITAAHWIFDWAPEDTWVYVFDPRLTAAS